MKTVNNSDHFYITYFTVNDRADFCSGNALDYKSTGAQFKSPEIIRGVLQSLQVNSGTVYRVGHHRSLQIFSNSLLTNHPNVRRYTL